LLFEVIRASGVGGYAQKSRISLHNSYTAKNRHIIHNKNNRIQKFSHPLRMTAGTKNGKNKDEAEKQIRS